MPGSHGRANDLMIFQFPHISFWFSTIVFGMHVFHCAVSSPMYICELDERHSGSRVIKY
jgi:hypothetical protein